MSENHDIPVKEISELLDTVADKIPRLLNQLKATLYSAEAGAELGKAVGAFYKELVASGIPEQEALAMAKDYVNSLQSVLNQAKISHQG
jgi:uncharacterized protein YejL (UPF0352 family)